MCIRDRPNSPLNISFFWALICAALVWVFIWHTRWGYEIRSVGASQSASAYAGISYPKVVILAMVISGMLSGFFALNVLQGELHQIKLNFVEGEEARQHAGDHHGQDHHRCV